MPQVYGPGFLLPDISPVDCLHCGGRAHLIRRTPHPEDVSSELRTFECSDCGSEIEMSVAE